MFELYNIFCFTCRCSAQKKKRSNKNECVWEMDADSYIIVKLDKHGRGIGPEVTTLTRFIGSLVRRKQFAPIKYLSWKAMPDKDKDVMVQEIEVLY
jgi:hypothetical protein